MRLRDYLRSDLIVTDLRAEDMPSTIRLMAERLGAAGAVPSAEEALRGLLAREEAHTTVMGEGLAIPHATLEGLQDPVILVALAPEAIPFGPDPADPVRVFFALLSPPNRQGEHIKLLARICRLVKHRGFVDDLLAAPTPDEALERIRHVDEAHV